MNTLEFFVRRIAARLGLVAPRHYLRVATDESIQLKEMETRLGELAWADLAHVDELTNEYWRIRQITTEQAKLQEDLVAAQEQLAKVQEEASAPDTLYTPQLEQVQERLDQERDKLTEKLQAMQDTIHKAEMVRKKFNGLKLKLTVLKSEDADETVLAGVREELQTSKLAYGELVREVENLRGEIQLAEDKVKLVESEEENLRGRIAHRERVIASDFSNASRRVIELGSRISILDVEKAELFVTIGRLLTAHRESESPELKDVLRKFSKELSQARTVDRSIEFNRRLADYR